MGGLAILALLFIAVVSLLSYVCKWDTDREGETWSGWISRNIKKEEYAEQPVKEQVTVYSQYPNLEVEDK